MEEEKFPIPTHSKAWLMFQRISVVIALVASLATVIVSFLQLRSEKRVLEIQIISADQLTRLPSVSGLSGEFTYNKIPVTNLWRIKLKFANTGDATLVGEGPST